MSWGNFRGRGAHVDGHLHLKEREGLTFSEVRGNKKMHGFSLTRKKYCKGDVPAPEPKGKIEDQRAEVGTV
jgi:hypothetical protein